MTTISMLEFRGQAESILKKVCKGQSFLLTYRGKPIARLEPVGKPEVSGDDPVYDLASLATSAADPLTNKQMDQLIYGP